MSNRRELLLDDSQATLSGIDFVEIADDAQTTLHVHFLKAVPGLVPDAGDPPTVTDAKITGGDTITTVKVLLPVGPWSTSATGAPVLTLQVKAPGDFSLYTLTLVPDTLPLDPFFAKAVFSFKAGCPSTLDCEAPPAECPEEPSNAPPIDYLAKDFLSFRKALFDFSALRYPEWQERSEADFGVMFAEALSYVADDLSYLQDRIAAESSLDTATERRSVVRHARLVDYEPRAATAARVLLRFVVLAATTEIAAGLAVGAQGPDGAAIPFETGTGLADALAVPQHTYPVDAAWNSLTPYYWDDSLRCLRAGSTETWVLGWGLGLEEGQLILIETAALNPADPPIREIVRLAEDGEQVTDPLVIDPLTLLPTKLTHLVWSLDDALEHDHDLDPARTFLAGNLVPATQGRRFVETIDIPKALTRTGANGTPQYLHTLAHAPLAWLAPEGDAGAAPVPEIEVKPPSGAAWQWSRRLLAADSFDEAFTVDPVRYSPVGERHPDGSTSAEYDGRGDTIRFGDGVFGMIPDDTAIFDVTYRTGGGAAGNVAADSITQLIDPALQSAVSSVSNPLAAEGGSDEETDEAVRRLAPHAFREKLLRAVRAEDYETIAEQLAWVQRAGTTFRYTGSWLTVFTSADPIGKGEVSPAQQLELFERLDRARMAGYESYALPPRFVSIDLQIYLCARADAFRGDVQEAVLEALSARRFADGSTGFFHVDRFTFGRPLERSALEAVVQRARGVDGVREILYRRRGYTSGYVDLPQAVTPAVDEILRVDNDPSRPERGSVRVYVEGGK